MKKIVLVTLLFSMQFVTAQNKVYEQQEVDYKAQFPGGLSNFANFVQNNLKVTDKNDLQKNIRLEFIVEITGMLTDIKVVNPNPKEDLLEKEAVRIMKLSPKWSPGAYKGKAVRCHVVQSMFNPHNEYEDDLAIEIGNGPSPPESELTDDNTIFNSAGIEVKPEFPGGMQNFYKFFNINFKFPEVDEEIKGKVFVTFVVEKEGTLSDIKGIRDIGYGIGREVIRVLKISPKWNPGQQNGRNVRVMYSMPFAIDKREKTEPANDNNIDPIKDKH